MKFKNILQISPSATSPALGDKSAYPSFARTVPSDLIMSRMLVVFIKSVMKWSEIGIISSDTAYSRGGMETIVNAANEYQIAINCNIIVTHGKEAGMFQKSIDALQGGNRAFIVFLHTSDILLLCKAMEKAAYYLNIEISNIVLIFSETVIGLYSDDYVPRILNGSFALKPENGQRLHTHKNMVKKIQDVIKSIKSCSNLKSSGSTMCDCIKDEWKSIFLIDHDFDTSTPHQCSFPSDFNSQEYYTPFAYDAVLTIVNLYHDLITNHNVKKIEEGQLKNHLMASGIKFNGATGSVGFDNNGNRYAGDLKFTIINLFNNISTSSNASSINNGDDKHLKFAGIFKQTGTISGSGIFEFCTNINTNLPCVPKLVFSTNNGVKPMSVIRACEANSQCGEAGMCLDDGTCSCPPWKIGINCQQILFSKRTVYENKDGSDRCLPFAEPMYMKNMTNTSIKVGIEDWPSQQIVSEIAIIVLNEIM